MPLCHFCKLQTLAVMLNCNIAYNLKLQTTITTVPCRFCFHGTYNKFDRRFVSTIIIIATH